MPSRRSRRAWPSSVRRSHTITAEQEMCGMSAWGKPPKTEAFNTAPLASAAIAMSMMSFMDWGDLARERAPERPRGALGRRAHVDVRIGAVAGDDGGVVDHARGHVRVEVEAHRDRQGGRHRANPAQQLT